MGGGGGAGDLGDHMIFRENGGGTLVTNGV